MKAAYYPLLILIVGLALSFVLVREHPVAPVITERNVNLAMRQIAHELLRENGDSYSQIPQVKLYGKEEFILPVESHLDYDKLIEVGPEILAQYGIKENYNLALLDCSSSALLFGFDASSLVRKAEPACISREQDQGCYNLSFSLTNAGGNGPRPMLYIMGGLALVSIVLRRFEPETRATTTPDAKEIPIPEDNLLRLSQYTIFSFSAQQLNIGGQSIDLTYREAKLLDFLAQHPNEVLDRERIHAAVWGSEGVMVGRSLDVFISRLRKKLAADKLLEIATVHGVGYRFKTGIG